MKTFIADIIPSIKRFSRRLDELTLLTDQHWVSLGEIKDAKKVFIFCSNKQLLISTNGVIEKGKWDFVGSQSLILETKDSNYLMKHGFLDDDIFALKLDGTNSYVFLINETRYHNEINSLQDAILFLERKYLKSHSGTSSKIQLNEFCFKGEGFPDYSEDQRVLSERFFGSSFEIVRVNFNNSFSDYYHFYPSKKKYSYRKHYVGEVFFTDKNACLRGLYEDRLKFIDRAYSRGFNSPD